MTNMLLCAVCLAALLISCKTEKEMNNPLLTPSGNRYGAPAFDKIKTGHYLPAFRQAIAEGKKEIESIINNPEEPDFENTIRALWRMPERLWKMFRRYFSI